MKKDILGLSSFNYAAAAVRAIRYKSGTEAGAKPSPGFTLLSRSHSSAGILSAHIIQHVALLSLQTSQVMGKVSGFTYQHSIKILN